MPLADGNGLDRRISLGILLAGAAVGLCAFAYYYQHGLTTAHFDAKAHLVVARRIIDSTTPGYVQLGAHWLPLVHLLYLPFVVFDFQYRTGLIPSLLSVAAFALSGRLVFRIAAGMTGKAFPGVFAAAIFLANPNLWLLHSAPLTEPIYMVLMLYALDAIVRVRGRDAPGVPWAPACWAAAGALCRYEGWIFVGGAIALTGYDWWTRRIRPAVARRTAGAYAGLFVVPVALHFGYVHWRIGDSFLHRVARGNTEPFETFGRPFLSVFYHLGELAQIATIIPLLIGVAGTVYCLADGGRRRTVMPLFLLWLPSLVNIAALHWGLMYRVRYSTLLMPAVAVFGGFLVAHEGAARRVLLLGCLVSFALPWVSWLFPREWQYHFLYHSGGILILPAAALVLWMSARAARAFRLQLLALAVLAAQLPALEGEYHALAAEATEHRYLEVQQGALIGHISRNYDGTRILIDIGRLAPLMYDLKLPLRDFVCHDGDTMEWDTAIASPRRVVGWICAERGDEVWNLLQVDPRWADGYALALKTEDYVIFRRSPEARQRSSADGLWP